MIIKNDTLKVFLPRILNFIVGTLVIILIGKNWGALGNGNYSVFLTYFVLTSQLAIFGLDSLLLHHVGEEKLPQKFFSTILSFHIFVISPIIFALFYIFKSALNFEFINEQNILLVLFSVMANVGIVLVGFYKLSKKEFKVYSISIIFKPLLQMVFILLSFFNIYEFSILQIVVYPILITFLLLFCFVIKDLSFKFDKSFFCNWCKIISQGKWIYFSSIIYLLNSKGIILITNKYGTIESVGVLFVALTALDIISYFGNAFGDLSQIDMAKLSNDEKFLKFASGYRHILMINSLIGVISLPFVYFVFPLISSEFASSVRVYFIILPTFVLISSSKMMSVYFISLKKAHYGTISTISTLIVIFVSSLFLIKNYGVMGASLSVAFGYLSAFIIDLYLIYRIDGYKKVMQILLLKCK